SAARAVNVLHYLTDFGADEERFSVAGYADTRPVFTNDTAEGRAYNRRVDIIILDEGHF
ncbi:MAG TPA: OmpA family protein, partial [Treponemataceae bacterium]|nr:OmpA family protein [Treponemataceae bacterium]